MKRRKADVVMAGHLCLDLTPHISGEKGKNIAEAIKPGKLLMVGPLAISTGGPVSNTGLAMAKLGSRVKLMSKVGDDFVGRGILDFLSARADTSGMKVTKGASSYTVVISAPGFDRMFLHCPATNDTYGYKDVNFSEIRGARLFHFGYPPLLKRIVQNDGDELAKIYSRVRKMGVTTSLDMCVPDPGSETGKADWNKIYGRTLPFVDVFLPSAEEAMFTADRKRFDELEAKASGKSLTGFFTTRDLRNLCNKFISQGVNICGIKCGERGIYLRTAPAEAVRGIVRDPALWSNRELWCPTFSVKDFASGAGAGDASIAGFLRAFLDNKSPEECLKYANAVGAQCVRAVDTTSGIGTYREATALVKNPNAEMNEPGIDEPGWTFYRQKRLWAGPLDGKEVLC